MQINGPNLQFLFQQWDQRYQQAFEEAASFYKLFSTDMPSDSEQTIHSWLLQQGGLREWVGARQIDNVATRDYTLRNKDWEKTIGLDRNKVADDTYGVFGPVVDDLGMQGRQWPDDQMTPLIEAGVTSEAWDGEAFFDTDHPVDIDDASKGTYSNNLIGATYDLSADPVGAYAAARAHGMKYKGEGGRPLNVMFDTMMVPPDLERFALTVANAQLTAQAIKEAAANVGGAGVTNVYQGSIQVITNPRLVNQSAWYLMVTRRPIRPFIWQQRQAPNLVSLFNPTDPNVFFLRKFLYGVDARGAGGYSFPFLCARMAPS